MTLVFVIITVLLVGVLAAVVVQRVPVGPVEPAVTSESFPGVPEGPLRAQDLADLRFDLALRGYRMSQVDATLHRMTEELAARDAEIARLRGEGTDGHV